MYILPYIRNRVFSFLFFLLIELEFAGLPLFVLLTEQTQELTDLLDSHFGLLTDFLLLETKQKDSVERCKTSLYLADGVITLLAAKFDNESTEALLEYVNAFLEREKENGRLEELAEKYIYRNSEEAREDAA